MRAGSCMSQQGSCTTPASDKQRAAPAAGAGQGFDSQLVTPSQDSPKSSGQGWDSSTTNFTNTTFLVLSNQHHPAVRRGGKHPTQSWVLQGEGTLAASARAGNGILPSFTFLQRQGLTETLSIKLVTRCNTLIFNNVTFIKRRTFFA